MKTLMAYYFASVTSAIAIALLIQGPSPAKAGQAEDAIAATVDLYERMTKKDAKGYLEYRPQAGYSSFNPDTAEMQVLEASVFEKLFGSDIAIKLGTEGLKAREFGDAVLITGTRIGYMVKPDQPQVERRYALTMLWSKESGRLKLQHVHYSLTPERK